MTVNKILQAELRSPIRVDDCSDKQPLARRTVNTRKARKTLLLLCSLLMSTLMSGFVTNIALAESKSAADEYLLALEENKKDVGSYLGLAQIRLAQGALSDAQEAVDQGLRYAKTGNEVLLFHSVGIEIDIAAENFALAKSEYRKAKKINGYRNHGALNLAVGKLYLRLQDFKQARFYMEKAQENKTPGADDALDRLVAYEIATKASSDALVFSETISRGELAYLIVSEFGMQQYLPSKPATRFTVVGQQVSTSGDITQAQDIALMVPEEIEFSPYKDEILRVDRMGFRHLHIQATDDLVSFDIDAKVTRQDMAFLIEDVLHAASGISRTQYLGTQSPYSDLSSSSTGFNAMLTAVTHELIKARADGTIRPNEEVFGAQCIQILSILSGILKQSPKLSETNNEER